MRYFITGLQLSRESREIFFSPSPLQPRPYPEEVPEAMEAIVQTTWGKINNDVQILENRVLQLQQATQIAPEKIAEWQRIKSQNVTELKDAEAQTRAFLKSKGRLDQLLNQIGRDKVLLWQAAYDDAFGAMVDQLKSIESTVGPKVPNYKAYVSEWRGDWYNKIEKNGMITAITGGYVDTQTGQFKSALILDLPASIEIEGLVRDRGPETTWGDVRHRFTSGEVKGGMNLVLHEFRQDGTPVRVPVTTEVVAKGANGFPEVRFKLPSGFSVEKYRASVAAQKPLAEKPTQTPPAKGPETQKKLLEAPAPQKPRETVDDGLIKLRDEITALLSRIEEAFQRGDGAKELRGMITQKLQSFGTDHSIAFINELSRTHPLFTRWTESGSPPGIRSKLEFDSTENFSLKVKQERVTSKQKEKPKESSEVFDPIKALERETVEEIQIIKNMIDVNVPFDTVVTRLNKRYAMFETMDSMLRERARSLGLRLSTEYKGYNIYFDAGVMKWQPYQLEKPTSKRSLTPPKEKEKSKTSPIRPRETKEEVDPLAKLESTLRELVWELLRSLDARNDAAGSMIEELNRLARTVYAGLPNSDQGEVHDYIYRILQDVAAINMGAGVRYEEKTGSLIFKNRTQSHNFRIAYNEQVDRNNPPFSLSVKEDTSSPSDSPPLDNLPPAKEEKSSPKKQPEKPKTETKPEVKKPSESPKPTPKEKGTDKPSDKPPVKPPETSESLKYRDVLEQLSGLFSRMRTALEQDMFDAAKKTVVDENSGINATVKKALDSGNPDAIRAVEQFAWMTAGTGVELKDKSGRRYRLERKTDTKLFDLVKLDEGIDDKEREVIQKIVEIFNNNDLATAIQKLLDFLRGYLPQAPSATPPRSGNAAPPAPPEGPTTPPGGPTENPRLKQLREQLAEKEKTLSDKRLERGRTQIEWETYVNKKEILKTEEMNAMERAHKMLIKIDQDITQLEKEVDDLKKQINQLSTPETFTGLPETIPELEALLKDREGRRDRALARIGEIEKISEPDRSNSQKNERSRLILERDRWVREIGEINAKLTRLRAIPAPAPGPSEQLKEDDIEGFVGTHLRARFQRAGLKIKSWDATIKNAEVELALGIAIEIDSSKHVQVKELMKHWFGVETVTVAKDRILVSKLDAQKIKALKERFLNFATLEGILKNKLSTFVKEAHLTIVEDGRTVLDVEPKLPLPQDYDLQVLRGTIIEYLKLEMGPQGRLTVELRASGEIRIGGLTEAEFKAIVNGLK